MAWTTHRSSYELRVCLCGGVGERARWVQLGAFGGKNRRLRVERERLRTYGAGLRVEYEAKEIKAGQGMRPGTGRGRC